MGNEDKTMSKKILIIGPSGSGKTHISAELRKSGINAIDADLVPGLSGWFDKQGKEVEYPEDAGKGFLDNHEFLWNKKFLKDYLEKQGEVYLFGLSGNVFDVTDLFDRVYFLKVERQVLAENLRHESRENPMGRTDYQLENALKYAEEIERKAGEVGIEIIDATGKPSDEILKEITQYPFLRYNKDNMKTLARYVVAIIGNAIGFLVADYFIAGFSVTKDPKQLLILAFVFALLNFILKPILKLVLGPIIILTLGLGILAINAGMLFLLDRFSENLTIATIPALVYASLIIGAVNFIFHMGTKKN